MEQLSSLPRKTETSTTFFIMFNRKGAAFIPSGNNESTAWLMRSPEDFFIVGVNKYAMAFILPNMKFTFLGGTFSFGICIAFSHLLITPLR